MKPSLLSSVTAFSTGKATEDELNVVRDHARNLVTVHGKDATSCAFSIAKKAVLEQAQMTVAALTAMENGEYYDASKAAHLAALSAVDITCLGAINDNQELIATLLRVVVSSAIEPVSTYPSGKTHDHTYQLGKTNQENRNKTKK